MEGSRFPAAWRASAAERGDWKGKQTGRREGRGNERPGEGLRAPGKRPQISSLPRGRESPKSSAPRGGPDRDPQPARSRRPRPPPPDAEAGVPHGRARGAAVWKEAVRTPRLSPPLLLEAAPGYLSGGGPAPPPPPRLRPPFKTPLRYPRQHRAPPRLGAHGPRLLLRAPRTVCCRAAGPQSSQCSSGGSSGGPGGSALGRRRRCSVERRRDPRGGTSATPKAQPRRRAPASALSAAAAAEGAGGRG